MNQYSVNLKGLTPLLMHNDNLAYSEKIMAWRKDPGNKEHSIPGDDRTPPWTWLGYIYHDGAILGVPSDNLMTMLREGSAKLLTGKGRETYKKQSQSGVAIDQQQFNLLVNGSLIPLEALEPLVGNLNFGEHIAAAEALGFELLVKRGRIGQTKNVRVRPMFRQWELQGSLTVLDEEQSGLTQDAIQKILNLAGSLCGLCDWRPSSPRASGPFGKFQSVVTPV